MALRPRLWPGVPLSWECCGIADSVPLGTGAVKEAGEGAAPAQGLASQCRSAVSPAAQTGFEPYFHSQTFEWVFPALSTSYSKMPATVFNCASFSDAVLKYRMPR